MKGHMRHRERITGWRSTTVRKHDFSKNGNHVCVYCANQISFSIRDFARLFFNKNGGKDTISIRRFCAFKIEVKTKAYQHEGT